MVLGLALSKMLRKRERWNRVEARGRAFNDMKEIADRAIKLAEIGKKSPLQEVLEWVIRVAIFAAAYLLAK